MSDRRRTERAFSREANGVCVESDTKSDTKCKGKGGTNMKRQNNQWTEPHEWTNETWFTQFLTLHRTSYMLCTFINDTINTIFKSISSSCSQIKWYSIIFRKMFAFQYIYFMWCFKWTFQTIFTLYFFYAVCTSERADVRVRCNSLLCSI